MDDMSGILARDFGIRPQGKAAPMAASKTASTHRSTSSSSTWTGNASPSYDDFFNPTAPSATANSNSKSTVNQPHDPILDTFNKGPVFDTPVYDDDIFDGVPGVKSSSTMRFDDVFGSGPSDRSHIDSPPTYDDLLGSLGSASGRVDRSHAASPPPYDDFLGGLGTGERKDDKVQGSVKTKGPDLSGFDDLLPGFGSSVRPPQPKREAHETDLPKPPKAAPSVQDDPFSVFETVTSTPSVPSTGLFSDPLDEFATSASGPTKVDSSPTADNLFSENRNSFESGPNHSGREKSADLNGSFRVKDNPKIIARDTSPMGSFHEKGTNERSPLDDFEMPRSQAGHRSVGSDSFSRNKRLVEDQSPDSSENSETGEDIWLTVSEIPLFTRPTSAPPPSRPPPPLTIKPKSRQNYSFNNDSSSPVDDLEDFAMGKPHPQKFEFDEGGEMERSSAAMKDAMNKAEAKFRHAKGVREKMRSKEAEQQERDDADREIAEKEREVRDREERERRRIAREEEEKRRKEKEERDKARLAVERATREARERAATEAKLRAERAAVLRAQQEARERASVDARERAAADREAREKAAAEAAMEREREREREAREKAAAERLEREKAEAEKDKQRRDQRAAVERAAAEARERLAQAAKERHQQKSQAQQRRPDPVQQRRPDPPQQQPQRAPEDDLESFFGSRANSAPRPARPPPAAESLFETQTPSRNPFDMSRRAASVSGASIPKPPSSVNMMDDLSAIFGGPSSSGGEFQEIDGESEERRKARWDREQRTKERAQKALQEKNERDMLVQREQAERDRIGESLDFEIKRWAAGKEGNLRALLSSMHYILWQECGWQPVSMSDLITAAAVKKVYRKATLCIHPDKVQQKGATLQQKYIAEKVFDILKEAWNKFNSEELF